MKMKVGMPTKTGLSARKLGVAVLNSCQGVSGPIYGSGVKRETMVRNLVMRSSIDLWLIRSSWARNRMM